MDSSTNKARWRDSRETIPARRRRRRHHRRHTKRGGTYYPFEYDINIAQNGVRNRLGLGVVAISFAMGCLIGMSVPMLSHFAIVAFATFGFCSLCAGFALIASARREESVHQIASETVLALEHVSNHSGEDGTV